MPVGNVTTATIGNLNDATSYYFTVRPINRMGFESLPSNEVAHRTLDAAASRLTVNNGSGSGNYIAGTIVTVSSNPPPSGKAFDRWLNDWVRYESQTLEPVGIPAEAMAPLFQFLVEIIRQDVAEQRGKRSALRRTFLPRLRESPFHDPALQISPDQSKHPLVLDPARHPRH